MIATAEPQLPADVVQLAPLCSIQVFFWTSEVGAGVNHALIQPEGVKLGGKIVVIADGLSVPLLGVNRTPQIGRLWAWSPAIVCGGFPQQLGKVQTLG